MRDKQAFSHSVGHCTDTNPWLTYNHNEAMPAGTYHCPFFYTCQTIKGASTELFPTRVNMFHIVEYNSNM